MTEHEVFETRLRSALARHVANSPAEFDALAFARAVAAAEPRQRGPRGAIATAVDAWRADRRPWWSILAPPAGSSPALRMAWIVALTGLLLAATVSAIFVGSELLRRANDPTVVPPSIAELTIDAHPGGVAAVAWSPAGDRLATVGYDGTARICDAATGEELATFRLAASFGAGAPMGFNPDGARLALGMKVYDAATGEELLTLPEAFMAYSPDGTRVAAAGDYGWAYKFVIADAATGSALHYLGLGSQSGISGSRRPSMTWSPDGLRVAGTLGGGITVRDATTGEEKLSIISGFTEPPGSLDLRSIPTDVAWSPDGSMIAGAGGLGTARIWDAATGKVVASLRHHASAGLTAIAWSPDATRVATAGYDHTARIWDPTTGAELATLAGHASGVTDVAWSPDGGRIATAGDDGTVQVRRAPAAADRQPRVTPPAAEDPDPRALEPVGEPTVADTALGRVTWQIYSGYAPDLGTPHGPVATEGAELLWLGPGGRVERISLPVEAQGLLPVGDGLIAHGTSQGYSRGLAWSISWTGDRWVVGEELDVPPTLFGSNATEVRAAAGPRGVLIVGYDVAVAADGRHFITATQRPGGDDKLAAKVGPILATNDGFVALVASDQSQFDAEPAFEPVPWFSADGLAWEAAASTSPFGDGSWIWDVAARDGRYVAVGEHRTAWAAWVSDDGRSWELLAELGLGRDRSCSTCPIGVTASDDGWVISTGKHQSLWASADGRTWEPLTVPTISIEEPWGFLPPVALGADTIVVVGSTDPEGTTSAVGSIEP